MKFSISRQAFYPDNLEYADLPTDLREVDIEFYQKWCRRPADGSRVELDDGGNLVFGEAPEPSLDDVKNWKVQMLREDYNNRSLARVWFTNAARYAAEYSCTEYDKTILQAAIDAGSKNWTVNLWLDAKGAPVAPITFKDLQGLMKAMNEFAPPTHDLLLNKVSEVLQATTAEEVHAVTL